MAKLEAGDKSSKSLLTNVLDMDDDFLVGQLNNLAEGGGRSSCLEMGHCRQLVSQWDGHGTYFF